MQGWGMTPVVVLPSSSLNDMSCWNGLCPWMLGMENFMQCKHRETAMQCKRRHLCRIIIWSRMRPRALIRCLH